MARSIHSSFLCMISGLSMQISAPVLACAISDDCRHLLAAIGNGYIFRYEYRKPCTVKKSEVEDRSLDDAEAK